MNNNDTKQIGKILALTLHECSNVEQRIGAHAVKQNLFHLVETGVLTFDKFKAIETSYRAELDRLEPRS